MWCRWTAAVELTRELAPAVNVHMHAPRQVHLHGDPQRIRQVLDNLLSNARYATPDGGQMTVRSGTYPGGTDGNGLGLAIAAASPPPTRAPSPAPSRSAKEPGSSSGCPGRAHRGSRATRKGPSACWLVWSTTKRERRSACVDMVRPVIGNDTGRPVCSVSGRTTVMSVAAKSLPVHSTGCPVRSASA